MITYRVSRGVRRGIWGVSVGRAYRYYRPLRLLYGILCPIAVIRRHSVGYVRHSEEKCCHSPLIRCHFFSFFALSYENLFQNRPFSRLNALFSEQHFYISYETPYMVERKHGHHVVVTSTVGIINTPFRSGYGASKHALHGFYDALRAEHYDDNVKVTIVLPGYIKTNISYNALAGDGSKQNKMDPGQEKGMAPDKCARSIIKAIESNKNAAYIGGLKEKMGIYLKRFWPKAAAKAIRKLRVT